jgi:acetate CoA/acetoacetate CoA-transferase alpha subunit
MMLPGFTNVGSPNEFIMAMVRAGVRDLDLITNDAGNDQADGIGTLVCQRRVRSLTASHIGLNPEAGRQMNSGEMKVTLVPQGTLAERIRCGGFGLVGPYPHRCRDPCRGRKTSAGNRREDVSA